MATVTTSSFLNLNWSDFLRGLLMAVAVPVITIISQSLDAGTLVFNWKAIGIAALSGGLAYILKNLFSPATIKITDVDKETMKAVKEGDATAVVMPAKPAA